MSEFEAKTGFHLVRPPEYAGRWVCGDIKVSVMKKPRWFHRKMMLLVLGIDWEDIK